VLVKNGVECVVPSRLRWRVKINVEHGHLNWGHGLDCDGEAEENYCFHETLTNLIIMFIFKLP
jgi:hypothetical protein